VPEITIGKYEAAEENLLAALNLYFEGAHFAPIHTLAAAANEVIEKLAEQYGVSMHVMPASRIEKADKSVRKIIFSLLKKPQNFLKHANDTSEQVCKLQHIHTEYYLFEASRHLWLLGNCMEVEQKKECLVIAAYYVMYFYTVIWPLDEEGRPILIVNLLLKTLSNDIPPIPQSNDRNAWGKWFYNNIDNIFTLLLNCVSSPYGQSIITDFLSQPDIQLILNELLEQEEARCHKS